MDLRSKFQFPVDRGPLSRAQADRALRFILDAPDGDMTVSVLRNRMKVSSVDEMLSILQGLVDRGLIYAYEADRAYRGRKVVRFAPTELAVLDARQ